MKYNESLRAKGIGRKQLAFPTGNKYSELQNDESEFESITQESTLHEANAVGSRMVGIAKSSATAAASHAQKSVQNYPWQIDGVTDFAMSGSGGISVGIPFKTLAVSNANYYYDPRDRFVYVNESGYYFVKCFLYSTAIQGTYDWGLKVITNVGSATFGEIYETYIDLRNSNKHPNVTGTTIINLPNQDERLNEAGRYGFQVQLYTTSAFTSFLNTNTYASLQVFKLSDLYESTRTIYAKQ
jgi:hypothetical protein